MAATIYGLCALVALLCAFLLLRAWGYSRYRLLLWSGLCFAGLTVNNVLLIIDKIFLPTQIDLSLLRILVSLISIVVLLFGLIWEAD
ncbi:MAG TPA: DUF5985 family protein [Rhizomicrobium sp.]|jgi:hypothetical protein|nr:DUF5985 family protein [Rhizomicrobium sp.]